MNPLQTERTRVHAERADSTTSEDALTNRVILFAVAMALAAATTIAITGGGLIDLGVVVLSARRPGRAMAAAGLLLILRLAVARARRQRLTGAQVADELAAVGLGSLVMTTIACCFVYLVPVAGGLDSYGYVSAAEAITRVRLKEALPAGAAAAAAPAEAAVPLGWILSPDRLHMVPEFPLGFPLVLSACRALGGREVMFYAPPLLGLGTIILAFALMRRLVGTWTAALAAIVVATNPVFFDLMIQPMSDVPAAFWTLLAFSAAASARTTSGQSTGSSIVPAIVGGLAGAMAILTRPPLLLAVLFLIALCWKVGGCKRAVTFGAFALSGIVAQAVLQWALYGNPLVSGHGGAGYLFQWAAVPSNVANHVKWLIRVTTPVTLAAVVYAFVCGHRRFVAAAAGLSCAVAVPYFLYVVRFDDWEMLRFLLPGLVPFLMAAADGFGAFLRRVGRPGWVPAGTLAVATLCSMWNYSFVAGQATLDVQGMEARYPLAGEMVERRTPADAVVLAVQHSGSLRYYAHRITLRWDRIPPDDIEAVISAGQPVYILFEGRGEQDQFTLRFRGQLSSIDLEPLDRVRDIVLARLTTTAH